MGHADTLCRPGPGSYVHRKNLKLLQGGGPGPVQPRPDPLPLPVGLIPEPSASFDTADGWNVPANVVIAGGVATKNAGSSNNNLDYTVAGITPGMQTAFLYHAAMTAGTLNARWRAPTGANAPGSLGSGAGESFVSMPFDTVGAHAGPRATFNGASLGGMYYFNAFDLTAALAGLLDIYLLWGQSNMVGASATTDRLIYQSYEPRALVISGFESSSQGALNIGNGSAIHPSLGTNYGRGIPRMLADGVVMASTNAFGVSPAVSIAKAICSEGTEPGRTPIFVAAASGGTRLRETWDMTDGSDWLLMLAQIDYLMSLNPGNRIRGDFVCLGESDRSDDPSWFAPEMKTRVDYLRSTYNDHPTVFSEIGGPVPDANTEAMIAEQLKLQTGSGDPAELTQCTVVPRPTNWGPLENDGLNVHFPPKDNVVRGADAAEAMLQLLYPGTTATLT